ncbi:5-oxoprolinase subunit PxpB [Amphritea sp. 2_MG-2023]|uniref:5-oxoprolinase subunit PxpB n=1 Tax=Amphritea TaxID=515417 RepID=UPI001C072BEE|nr:MULTISPECIES: 5-oxoprolinase subunit PxpB [Amphritea]MBU2964222.1 5-oxoprolinase subunit PxpB [Amphritea atlantica]MDO6419521.1 5-oxoprolinase subunit PxpB [Amphritea sp. 2_MG-2023]
MRIEIAGENALIVYFGEKTDPRVSAQVQQAVTILESELSGKLIDMVPSYASLLVIYDQLATDHLEVRRCIRKVLGQLSDSDSSEGNLVILPAYYSTESGPDLEALAQRANLSIDDVIKLHSEMEYRVYAIGFAPGFAYLGEVDERIAAPRLSTPRMKVPRGAIAIADRQTAVYPAVSPGGWNLIGLCPTRMFDPKATPTMPVQVGDRIKFNPISREEFFAQGGELGEIK